jgi:hypothetical protein
MPAGDKVSPLMKPKQRKLKAGGLKAWMKNRAPCQIIELGHTLESAALKTMPSNCKQAGL